MTVNRANTAAAERRVPSCRFTPFAQMISLQWLLVWHFVWNHLATQEVTNHTQRKFFPEWDPWYPLRYEHHHIIKFYSATFSSLSTISVWHSLLRMWWALLQVLYHTNCTRSNKKKKDKDSTSNRHARAEHRSITHIDPPLCLRGVIIVPIREIWAETMHMGVRRVKRMKSKCLESYAHSGAERLPVVCLRDGFNAVLFPAGRQDHVSFPCNTWWVGLTQAVVQVWLISVFKSLIRL